MMAGVSELIARTLVVFAFDFIVRFYGGMSGKSGCMAVRRHTSYYNLFFKD